MPAWKEWLEQQRAASQMVVTPRSLTGRKMRPWGFKPDGVYARDDRRFWWLLGVLVEHAVREVPWWYQPLIKKIGDGVVCLGVSADGERVLLTARQEPGWGAAKVRLGPPLQASRGDRKSVV